MTLLIIVIVAWFGGTTLAFLGLLLWDWLKGNGRPHP